MVNLVILLLVLMVDMIGWSGEYDVSGDSVDLVMLVPVNLVIPVS